MYDKVIVGINGGHNSAIAVWNKGEFIVIEMERLFNHKNLSWCTFNLRFDPMMMTEMVKHHLKHKYGIDKIDLIRCINSDFENRQVGVHFNTDLIEHNQTRLNQQGEELEVSCDTGLSSGNGWAAYHHKAHASGTFYQSPFTEALVFSFDGGGDDGWNIGYHFNKMKQKSEQIETIHFSFNDYGNPYFYLGYFIDDISFIQDYGEACLTYSGKLMGYCSYGKVINEWVEPIRRYYNKWNREGWAPVESNRDDFVKELGKEIGLEFHHVGKFLPDRTKRIKGDDAKNLIATSQYVFEELHFNEIKPYLDKYKTNVCITGGCAMNILYNTRVRDYVKSFGKEMFVAPNSSDCGLATGLVLDHIRPQFPIDMTYDGEEIYDEDSIHSYLIGRNVQRFNINEVVKNICKENFIYGVVQGKAEHGPRALGNRSIICSPKEGMKDILNNKVKHREFFRPFAPIVRLQDVSKYFNWEGESRHMNFAATVKEEYKTELASITHADGTARIQTVTEEQNKLMYDLLSEVEVQGHIPVLLNTSFNVAGKPILNTYKDAFEIYDKEAMNGLIIRSKVLPYEIVVQ